MALRTMRKFCNSFFTRHVLNFYICSNTDIFLSFCARCGKFIIFFITVCVLSEICGNFCVFNAVDYQSPVCKSPNIRGLINLSDSFSVELDFYAHRAFYNAAAFIAVELNINMEHFAPEHIAGRVRAEHIFVHNYI